MNSIITMLRLETKAKNHSLLGILYIFLFKVFEVIPDVLYGFLIDTVIHKNRSFLFKSGFLHTLETIYILGLLILVSWIGNIYFQYLSSLQWKHAARIIQYRLRMTLCLDLLDVERHNANGNESVLESYRSANEEIETVEFFIHITMQECFKILFSIVIAGALLFYIAPQFLLYVVLPIPPMLFFAVFLQKKIRPHYLSIRKATKSMFAEIEELIGNLSTIQTFGKEERFYRKVETAASRLDQAYDKASAVNSAIIPVTRVFIQLGILGILVHGAVMVYEGKLAFGAFAATGLLCRKFLLPLSTIGGIVDKWLKGATSTKLLLDKLRKNVPQPHFKFENSLPLEQRQLARVSIRGLDFSYGQRVITERLHLEFQSERLNVIKGQTGVGKTTLFRLLRRELPLTSGVVFYGDTDIHHYSRSTWQKKIAFLPQSPKLFSATVLDNITLFDSEIDPRAFQQALEVSLVNQFIESLPNGIHTIVGPHGLSLSGGQIQSIAIARALYVEAEILLLDEPTTGFDLVREKIFLQAIRKVLKGKTVIVTSHRPQTIEAADFLFELRS